MKKNFDKILLGLLWVMTIVLATTFWMNVQYGFNIFSAAHWEYISGLQANRTDIKSDFYLSLILGILLALVGLYLIVRPRFRKIPMPTTNLQPEQKPSEQPNQPETEPKPNIAPTSGPKSSMRPPSPASLTVRKQPQQQFAPPTGPVTAPIQTGAPSQQKANPLATDMNTIMESVGYIMKPCKKIGKLNNPIVALGYDQTLWISTSDASCADMVDAIQKLVTVFDDTLGDSADDIVLHGCIINPTDTNSNDLITTFDSIDGFKQFMNEHKNTEPEDFDKELFDAISTYISTVTSYIGKE